VREQQESFGQPPGQVGEGLYGGGRLTVGVLDGRDRRGDVLGRGGDPVDAQPVHPAQVLVRGELAAYHGDAGEHPE